VCGGPFAAPAWGQQPPAGGAWPPQQPQGQPPAWGQQPAPPPIAPPPGWAGAQGQPPAWSQQPAPPPAGWTGSPPPAWQPPAKKKGGCSPLIIILLLLLLVGSAAAYVLIAKPFGGPGASPTPVALASPTAAAPTATATTAPSVDATVAPPSEEPSSAATGDPLPSSSVPAGDTASCHSDVAGVTVTYPADWVAYVGDPWTCMLFDPDPITIPANSELPMVGVAVFVDSRAISAVEADLADTTMYTTVDSGEGEVDGYSAVAYEVENTGNGFYQKGTLELIVLVDRGALGTLILETVGEPGDRYDANAEVLGQIIETLQID
jgi:hypothetical protein